MRIDFHTHAFPDRIAAGALEHLVKNTLAYRDVYGETIPHTDATAAGLLASSQRAGLDICLVLPIATSPKPSGTINDFAAQVDHIPGLRSFGSIHPLNPQWEMELRRVKELGLRGIKLHPEYQGVFADDPAVMAVVQAAGDLGLWVLFHAGADIGMPPPIHCTPQRVIRLRKAAPHAKIILAHLGGYCLWEEVLTHLTDMDVWVDTSFCLPNHPEKHHLFAQLIRCAGVDRVLFGTDSPWADQQESVEATLEFLKTHRFSQEETAAIMGGNAEKILFG